MNKIYTILFALLASFCITEANAQNSAGTNLNIHLNDIQSIKINESQSNVGISLNTSNDYINGKSILEANHIEIMSSSNYEIRVSAASNLSGEGATIDIGTVTLTPTQGNVGGESQGSITMSPTALSLTDNTLVQSTSGDIKRSFDIEYHVSGGSEYLNKPTGTYSTLITYTILMP